MYLDQAIFCFLLVIIMSATINISINFLLDIIRASKDDRVIARRGRDI